MLSDIASAFFPATFKSDPPNRKESVALKTLPQSEGFMENDPV